MRKCHGNWHDDYDQWRNVTNHIRRNNILVDSVAVLLMLVFVVSRKIKDGPLKMFTTWMTVYGRLKRLNLRGAWNYLTIECLMMCKRILPEINWIHVSQVYCTVLYMIIYLFTYHTHTHTSLLLSALSINVEPRPHYKIFPGVPWTLHHPDWLLAQCPLLKAQKAEKCC